jgi:hypothetical protein
MILYLLDSIFSIQAKIDFVFNEAWLWEGSLVFCFLILACLFSIWRHFLWREMLALAQFHISYCHMLVITTNNYYWLATILQLTHGRNWLMTELSKLPRLLSLYSLRLDCIENIVLSSSFIVTDMLANHCLATAHLFIVAFPHTGQCLSILESYRSCCISVIVLEGKSL